MMKLILASASPRRREILENLGVQFDVVTTDFDERGFIAAKEAQQNRPLSPKEQVESLALQKATVAASGMGGEGDFAVIGVDTSVVMDEQVLGKPRDEAEAFDMLKMLVGKQHFVISGVAVVYSDGTKAIDSEVTAVKMAAICDDEIRRYIQNEYVLDKAGAYAIQGRASGFIEGIMGCYFNVVGLPVFRLTQMLKAHGTELF